MLNAKVLKKYEESSSGGFPNDERGKVATGVARASLKSITEVCNEGNCIDRFEVIRGY